MKKIILSIVLLFVFIFNAQAASVLENKIAHIPADGALKADFKQQRHLAGIDKPIISTGTLLVWKDKGLIWHTQTPFASVILITSTGVYQIENNKKINIVQASSQSGDRTIFDTLGNVFAGDFSNGVPGFEIKTLPTQKEQWQIELLPAYPEIKNFIRTIDITGDQQISRVVISRPNGDRDVIDVNHHQLLDQNSISQQEKAWFNE